MIEQAGSDAIQQDGVAVQGNKHDLEESQSLDKLTQDRREKPEKKPRRFSYQSGSTVLSGYTIKRGIGIGGFGEVYFGISDAGKEVALKRIQRNLDVELRGVSQCLNLKHINLISLWDIRQDTEGESWVVMEYVPGESLRDVLEQNPEGVSIEEAQKWFTQILDGVAYLHDHGIVHRDLKPGNIFYDQDEDVVKIGDYGLSKFISTSKRDGQTEAVGTFHYMAPEIGKGSYGKEIDIYSLGIILCEVLSGRVPFDGESGQEIIMKHLTAAPEIDFIPNRFQSVILKALSKDPDHRFSSVREMLDTIDWPGSRGGGDRSPSATGDRPVIEPMFIRNDFVTPDVNQNNNPQPSESPFFIGDDDIVLGDVQTVGNHQTAESQRSASFSNERQPWTNAENGDIRMSDVRESKPGAQANVKVPVVADRMHSAEDRETVVLSSQPQAHVNEPIASAVGTGMQSVKRWWSGIGATPVKVGLVVLFGIFVLFNAEWLIPLCIGLGCLYMVYFAVRSQVAKSEERQQKKTATTIRPFSRAECRRILEERLRQTRLGLPFSEKLSESLGTLLIASVVISISTLVALGFSGYTIDGSVATLSIFAWLATTALMGTAVTVFSTKVMESEIGNQWMRRFILMSMGVLVGIVSYGFYQGFFVESIAFPTQVSSWQELSWITSGETGLMRFIAFFAGLFFVVRWWKVGDALRTTQFSLFLTVLHALLAVGIALLTSFPVIWALILGSVLSVAVQLSSTWIKTSERERIQFEVMQSISA